ncbi:trimethylamine methyltransferase family protein [bacterium]|nr:trimethylamine methyltransferase family protein [bacterium]
MIPSLRPKFELLTPELIQKIMKEAMNILEKQGVFVENTEVMNLFRESGMKVKESERRVFITPQLVQECLSQAPSVIKLYDRSQQLEFKVGEDEIHFDPGSAAVHLLDHKIQQQRKPWTEDLIRFSRLTDCLEHLHFQSTGLISSDVPETVADSYRLFISLQFSSKPIITGTFLVRGFQPMYEMLKVIRGNQKSLKEKPLAVFDACPSPPLNWSHLTSQSLIDCARAGIPSELISMGMTGATSPVTLVGTLVQHVAENLSGLVISQLAEKGAPVIFGGSPSSFDMRKGTTPMGAIETMMIDSAYSQIGKYLHLPTHAYMGLSDAKINDSQSGMESGVGAVLAALSGINVISGPGMMNFESCQSLEKLVIDNEICGMMYRLLEGISQREEPLAEHLFEDFKPDTHFLSMLHTRNWYRKEHIFPKIVDRDTYGDWGRKGKKSMAERAHQEVERILQENPPALPDKDVVKELKKIMLFEFKKEGLSELPEIKY